MYKKPCKQMYHVFTDGYDNWFKTLKEAKKAIEQLKLEGHENLRIYKETNWDNQEGIFTDEDCIYSIGNFPY